MALKESSGIQNQKERTPPLNIRKNEKDRSCVLSRSLCARGTAYIQKLLYKPPIHRTIQLVEKLSPLVPLTPPESFDEPKEEENSSDWRCFENSPEYVIELFPKTSPQIKQTALVVDTLIKEKKSKK